jgi:hypothetical protein
MRAVQVPEGRKKDAEFLSSLRDSLFVSNDPPLKRRAIFFRPIGLGNFFCAQQ